MPPKPPEPVRPVGSAPARPPALSLADWTFWYHHNNDLLENVKKNLYSVIGSQPLFRLSGRDRRSPSDATLEIRAKVASAIVPALLRTLDPKKAPPPDLESAAYIALAKVTGEPKHIDLLLRGLERGKSSVIVAERAAIALGLLRRRDDYAQFDAKVLDRVRQVLFAVFEDEKRPTSVRGAAALALGLLGDQPTRSDATVGRLFELLKAPYEQSDLAVGLLMAIGLQPAPHVTEAQREVLRACAQRGRLYEREVPLAVRSYAALALGRVGDSEKDTVVLSRAMVSRRQRGYDVHRSAAIGLGRLGSRVSGKGRVEAARALLSSMKRIRDGSTINFATISLAHLVVEDVRAGKTDVVDNTEVAEFLLDSTARGRWGHRPFGALALGLIGRAIDETTTVRVYGEYRSKSLEALRAGLVAKKLAAVERSAFAVALGFVGDLRSVRPLVAVVSDKTEERVLRPYAALALGFIGQATRSVLTPLRAALVEGDTMVLRLQAATALVLLQDRECVPLLLAELARPGTPSTQEEILGVLGKVGDERAVDALVMLLRNEKAPLTVRAMACTALGMIGDLEWVPSLSRLSLDINYRNAPKLIYEMLSLH